MTADLTREDIAVFRHHGRVARDFLCVTGRDGRARVDHFDALLDMAEAHLDEPTRLAQARAEGYREGIEAAAQWHDDAAGRIRSDAEPLSLRRIDAIGDHEEAAAAIRALTPPPAEPGDWTVSDTELARDILGYLGIGSDASLEPGDRRRDRIAAMICADRERRIAQPAEASAPVAPDERRALNAEVQDYMIACGQHAESRRVAEARITALEAENAKLREGLKDTTAHLVAAHSLLSRTPRAKKAAPSNTMFDMMLRDYEASCERARALLQGQGGAS